MLQERLEALEARVRNLVEMVQELKRANAALQSELRGARERLINLEEISRRWERERGDIRSRVEKVLGDLEFIECSEGPKEVALD